MPGKTGEKPVLCRNGKSASSLKPEHLDLTARHKPFEPKGEVSFWRLPKRPCRLAGASFFVVKREDLTGEAIHLTTILLMGHGSRDTEGVDEFRQLADAVRATAADFQVEAGFLEFSAEGTPSIQEAFDRAVARGERHFIALPVLLHQAGHSKTDMPEQIASVLGRHPDVRLIASHSLPVHPSLLEIIEERIGECVPNEMLGETGTAILLVGRGSSDQEANADFFRIGRLLWERQSSLTVECAFVSLTRPSVAEGIDRCVRLGAHDVMVIPYFINTGVLVKRIASQVAEARPAYPSVQIAIGQHLGPHPKLVQLLLNQARELAKQGPGAPIPVLK